MYIARDFEHDILGDDLYRPGEIHFTLADIGFRLPRRPTKQCVKLAVGHGQAGCIVKIAHIQPETAVVFYIQQLVQDQVDVLRFAIRGQAHQLVFAGIYLEAGIVGKC